MTHNFHMAGVEKCMHAFHGYNFHYYTSYTFQYIVSVESLKIKDRQGRIGNKAAGQSLRRLLYHLPATYSKVSVNKRKRLLYLKLEKPLFLKLQDKTRVHAAPGSVSISQYTVNPFPAAS